MNAIFKDVESWATGRGWRPEKTNGDHCRWKHPEVQDFVVTGATISDRHAIENIKSDMMKAEAASGLDLPKHIDKKAARAKRKPPRPRVAKFAHAEPKDGTHQYTTRCCTCNALGKIKTRPGAQPLMQWVVLDRLAKYGWEMSEISRKADTCPDCVVLRRRQSEQAESPPAPRAAAQVQTQPQKYEIEVGPATVAILNTLRDSGLYEPRVDHIIRSLALAELRRTKSEK